MRQDRSPAEARVADLIADACPDWTIASIELLGEGDFSAAFLVNGEWVVRLAKHEEAAQSLLRESCLLPRVGNVFEVRTPLPEVVSADSGRVLVRHQLLPGPALTRDRYVELAEPVRQRCATQVGRFLLNMHAIPVGLARDCGVEDLDYGGDVEELGAEARELLVTKLTADGWAFLERSLEPDTTYMPVVLHGDLSPDHVLYDEQSGCVSGVIDFGDVAIGHPAWDFVYIYEDYGLEFLQTALRAYSPVDVESFVRRLHSLYVLAAIEWAVSCAEEGSSDLADSLAQLEALGAQADAQLDELLAMCGAR